MKKIFYSLVLLLLVNQCFADWSSPSDGSKFTLQNLSEITDAVVCTDNSGSYKIVESITISTSDTLFIDASVQKIDIANDVTITITGTLRTSERSDKFIICGDSLSSNFFELRFEDASDNFLSDANIKYCSRIMLINSDITIDNCEFSNFSNHVVSFMNCNPIISNSYFHDNQMCAVQSAVNSDGSPQIFNNIFYNNVLSNSNNPQINIGPGTTDTIRIVGNRIEGVASNMSGGIGIMNMYNTQITNLLLKDNIVIRNRYGYTQNGYRISAYIENNRFEDNNLETNPNNGGSGVSIFGYDETNAAKLRNNLITGNLWGVTAIYYHNVDMGTDEDFGYNILYNNGNNGIDYELFNNSNSDLQAVGNYWGNDNEQHAEDVIFHHNDSLIYGTVTYSPIYILQPEITSFAFLKEENPALNDDYFGVIQQDNTIIVLMPTYIIANHISNLKPSVKMPLGVSVTPSDADYQDFSEYPIYTATTPHQTTRSYYVIVTDVISVEEYSDKDINIFPNPATDNSLYINNFHTESLNWQLISADGKVVESGTFVTGTNQINVAKLNRGIYILKCKNGQSTFSKKVIIQ